MDTFKWLDGEPIGAFSILKREIFAQEMVETKTELKDGE